VHAAPYVCYRTNYRNISYYHPASREARPTTGGWMDEINDKLWQQFEQLAKRYPHDEGVRMTADLARWARELRQRLRWESPEARQRRLRREPSDSG
jgi:hypothetical protein